MLRSHLLTWVIDICFTVGVDLEALEKERGWKDFKKNLRYRILRFCRRHKIRMKRASRQVYHDPKVIKRSSFCQQDSHSKSHSCILLGATKHLYLAVSVGWLVSWLPLPTRPQQFCDPVSLVEFKHTCNSHLFPNHYDQRLSSSHFSFFQPPSLSMFDSFGE